MPDSAARRPHDDSDPDRVATDVAMSSPPPTAAERPAEGYDEPTNAELRTLLLAVGEKLDVLLVNEASRAPGHAEAAPATAAATCDGSGRAHHVSAQLQAKGKADVITFHSPATPEGPRREVEAAPLPDVGPSTGATVATEYDGRPDGEGFEEAPAVEAHGRVIARADEATDAPPLEAADEAKSEAAIATASADAEAPTSTGIDDRLRTARERMEHRRAAIVGGHDESDASRSEKLGTKRRVRRRPERRRIVSHWDARQLVRLLVVVAVSVLVGLLLV